jgi:hypothetical protein
MAYSAAMDSISSSLALNQATSQNKLGVAVLKTAAQNDQQMAALIAQVAQAGQVQASNPTHLGQSLDTYA